MRNLKKILALVLALVMSLSLMATAGAAFTDAGEITESYQQAVDVLNGVNVFKGYENGSFVPKGNITRAEAAAIIYRISTGDVTDIQKDIYTAWNGDGKLSDVSGWYAGYVNYCCNAGYIKGYPNGTFQAQNNVTGYEVLAMVLRAMGYGRNNEFSGSQWAITTASLAQTLGITKNIKENLGDPATREMVAEIIFRAIFCETQQYNALHLYEGTGTNLAANLNLEKVSGVVTGNKWANLYDNKPMAEGKSRLALDDGSIYTVNADSTGEQIGLRVNAYVQNKTDVIGALETGENVVKSNQGAKTTVKKLRDELKVDDTTEYYVNYSDAVEIGKSDWRIEYWIAIEDPADWPNLVANNGGEWGYTIGGTRYNNYYNKVIRVGSTITAQDMEFMQSIFYGADSKGEASDTDIFYGEVFVATRTGTNDLGESYDISDDLSWREFINKYIDSTLEKFDGCDNGESLRVIDNDGDGVADYVLRVDFVMTTIVDYNKKLERWTVEYEDTVSNDVYTDIDNDDFVVDSELAVGDVILYALVDGVYYTEHPETFTGKIEKKGIDTKAGTIIVDGTTYTWSGIEREARQFFSTIETADVDTNYVYYKDHFGYIRLYTTPNGDLVLVTDGYFATDKRDDVVKATIYDETAKELADYTLADNNDYFVFETEGGDDWGNRGTWERLHTFGSYYYEAAARANDKYRVTSFESAGAEIDPFVTNIAIGAAAEGTTLRDVRSLEHRRYNYNAYEIGSTAKGTPVTVDNRAVKSAESKDATLWGIEWMNNTDRSIATGVDASADKTPVEIRATDMTKYYLVNLNSKGEITGIETWIGRNGREAGSFKMDRAYAVTSEVSTASSTNYKIAEAVVIEQVSKTSSEAVMPIRRVGSDSQESMTVSGVDRTELSLSTTYARQKLDAPVSDLDLMLRFYDTAENSAKDQVNGEITAEYASYGIYAGRMDSHIGTSWRSHDTIYRAELKSQPDTFEPYGDVEFLHLVVNEKRLGDTNASFYAYAVEDVENRINVSNDRVIYMTNADGEITMILDIDQTVDTDGDDYPTPQQLSDLYDEIRYDYMQYTWVRLLVGEDVVLGSHIKSVVAADASSKNGEYAPADSIRIPLADIRAANDLQFDLPGMTTTDWSLANKTIASGGITIHVGYGTDNDDYELIDATNLTSWDAKNDGQPTDYKNVWIEETTNYLYINGLDYTKGQWAEVYVHYVYAGDPDDVSGILFEEEDTLNEEADTITSAWSFVHLDPATPLLAAGDVIDDGEPWNVGDVVEVHFEMDEGYAPSGVTFTDKDGAAVNVAHSEEIHDDAEATPTEGKAAYFFRFKLPDQFVRFVVSYTENEPAPADPTTPDTLTVSVDEANKITITEPTMTGYERKYALLDAAPTGLKKGDNERAVMTALGVTEALTDCESGTTTVTLATDGGKTLVVVEFDANGALYAVGTCTVPMAGLDITVSDTNNALELAAHTFRAGDDLQGQALTLQVKEESVSSYKLPTTVTSITVGEDDTELTSDDYSYDAATGVITFADTCEALAAVTSMTITAASVAKTPITPSFTNSHLEITDAGIEEGEDLADTTLELTVKTGDEETWGVPTSADGLTIKTTVEAGEQTLVADTDYTYAYDAETETGTITFENTTKTQGVTAITVEATAVEYVTVSLNASNQDDYEITPIRVVKNSDLKNANLVVTAKDSGSGDISNVSTVGVTIADGNAITQDSDYTWNSSTGAITFSNQALAAGNIEISLS